MLRVFCSRSESLVVGFGVADDSPFRLRIQTLDLICRDDFDFRLPFVKFNCAGDADGFPGDHAKSLV